MTSERASALVKLRQDNEWLVVDALRRHGALSRARLVAVTGLSRSTIANLVGDLAARGVVEETRGEQARHRQTGRPGVAVALRGSIGSALGVVVDRERVQLAAFDLTGRELGSATETLAPNADADGILARIGELIAGLLAVHGLRIDRLVGVGFGLPGPVDIEQGGVDADSTLLRWAGVRAADRISAALQGVPVYPDNDANLGALGELHHGAGRDTSDLVYLRLGPGVGGGVIVDGRLYRGGGGFAGEFGHITAVPDGAPCVCGLRGCLSTVATTYAIGERLGLPGAPPTFADRIVEAAAAGDPLTIEALREAGTHTGRVLASLVNAFNPSRLILGGTLGARSPHVLEAAHEAVIAHSQPIANRALKISHAELGERSEAFGAVARVLQDEERMREFIARV